MLARRLSNAEYNYTIRDLTGVDIRPTREFPVDPANTAGFDNSGESLAMSPALLKKYLKAAHEVASHMYLKPEGFAFAPHPMLVETDRDKLLRAADHRFLSRGRTSTTPIIFSPPGGSSIGAALGKPDATLADSRSEYSVSAKYLATSGRCSRGAGGDRPAGEAAVDVAGACRRRGADEPDAGASRLRGDAGVRRRSFARRWSCGSSTSRAGPIGTAWQPFLIWKNVQYATHRRTFDPSAVAGRGRAAVQARGRGRAGAG